ncbi:MAG: TIR domain-containing protein [Mitsuaria chitosanitabida]|uniref:TIR domain-containing protein n=1 Tax=Roseateles chitosanitabidus TaxID=65048 RepID=UPI001B2EF848|nr:TIR domain-containing protein [Roseateles chitosanitabidus]MBO9687078.1 TIR domain-containing protein [Roseateles chitosanitabidus]
MARNAFYSFFFREDAWRASKVRNMGVVEGNKPAEDNDWETVLKDGDDAIRDWIDKQLEGRSVAIVLIGANTADREWVMYEIKKAWTEGLGVLGIRVHNLADEAGKQSEPGEDPFDKVSLGGKKLSSIVMTYDPPGSDSQLVYNYIKDNLAGWIEVAIKLRDAH